MNLTITQENTRTEKLGSEGSRLAHKLYEIASDQNNTVSLTGSISVPYAYADEVEYLNTNFGSSFNITAGGAWIKFYHQEIEDAIMSWASQNPNNVGANFASSGHITQDDADSITSWGKTFTGNTNITQFNEFEKFRNVTQVSQNDCFQSCTNLQSIKLPPRLTYIRGWMFNSCSSLSGVVLPASCTTIDTEGFAGCTSLTSIDLSNVTTLGNGAFKNSGITGVLDLLNLTQLGTNAFFQCTGITGVANMGSITSIPNSCFYNCGNLTSVVLPASCTSIGQGAFANDENLTTINLANITSIGGDGLSKTKITILDIPSLQSISGDWAFANCKSLTTVSDLGSVTSLPYGTFQNCTALTSVTLPSTCTSIGNSAFQNCTALHTIDLGANLTSVGQNAFGSSGITTFIFRSTTPPAYSGKFIDNMTGVTIYVPDAVVQDYQTAWPDMASNITGLTNYSAS